MLALILGIPYMERALVELLLLAVLAVVSVFTTLGRLSRGYGGA